MDDFGSPDEQYRRSILMEWFFKKGRYKISLALLLCFLCMWGSIIFSVASVGAEGTAEANLYHGCTFGNVFRRGAIRI